MKPGTRKALEFRGRYAYPLRAEVGVGTLGSWRDWHEGGPAFRSHLRTGRPRGDQGFVAGLEKSLGRPLHRRKPGPPAGRKRKRR